MNNTKLIIIALVAAALGLLGGYLLFGGQPAQQAAGNEHDHSQHNTNSSTWTCSMHPQIRKEEPGDCPICGMDLIPADEMASNDPLILEMTSEAVKLANIETTVIEQKGKAEKLHILSGKIARDERLMASQVAHIPGRVEELYITFTGEQVKKGQKLARLYSPELITAQRELLEALKIEKVNPALVQAARKKLEYWQIPAEQIKAIEEEQQIQEYITIFADASGIVDARRVAVGDYVQQGEVLFDIINLNRVWVLFDAYEEDLASIKVGNRVEFTTPAIPDRTFSTQITFIDPTINPDTRVASLRGEVKNANNLLKPEMFVRGKVKTPVSARDQLLVPKSAVLWTGPRSVVYVKIPNTTIPTFQFREVTLGKRLGDQYLIEEGLESGEEVVTYGNFAIDASAQLNNQASMMNQHIQVKGQEQSDGLPDYTASTPESFKQQLSTVMQNYLELKDAFVATDSLVAQKKARQLQKKLGNINTTLLEEEALAFWQERQKTIDARSARIASLENITEQRQQFEEISQSLIQLLKVFGAPERTYYVQYCPMAFDFKGAEWISEAEEIRNPYFGDEMLTCGTVQATVKAN